MPTPEDFQDGALQRANQLLAGLDPLACTEEELLMHGALLKIRNYLQASSLRGDLSILLAMITADFDDWISRPRNIAALVQALAMPASAEILLGDAPTLAKICASPAAIDAIAANAQALNIFLDYAPNALIAAPAAFQSLLGAGFFVARFVADPVLHNACFTSASLAPLIAADGNLLAAVFANAACRAAFFDTPAMVTAAAQSSVVADNLTPAALDAVWASSLATDAWLKSAPMIAALIANGDLAARLKGNYATIYNYVAATRAGLWDDAFLFAFTSTNTIYQAFFQHINATAVIDSEDLAVRLLRATPQMMTSLGSYHGNNACALAKNVAINNACGKNVDLAVALFKASASALFAETDGNSIPLLYDHIVSNPQVLAALLKDSTPRQRLNAESLLIRKAALLATLTDNPALFEKVIDNTTLSGVYGASGAYMYGRFHVLPDGTGAANTASAYNTAISHPCVVFIDQIGAATTTSTNSGNTGAIGGSSSIYNKTSGQYVGHVPMNSLYTDGICQGVAVGGFYFTGGSATAATAAAATATIWRVKG